MKEARNNTYFMILLVVRGLGLKGEEREVMTKGKTFLYGVMDKIFRIWDAGCTTP